jgi:putative endonuclease
MYGQQLRRFVRRVTLSQPLVDFYDRFASPQTLGRRGELEAERYLLRLGMVIVARGYQDKFGEIDLIAVDGETIVFVEVKTRTSDVAGLPAEAVDDVKQKHMTKTALGYLKWHRLTECSARFDVISITWPSDSKRPEIIHYKNAFEQVGEFQIF